MLTVAQAAALRHNDILINDAGIKVRYRAHQVTQDGLFLLVLLYGELAEYHARCLFTVEGWAATRTVEEGDVQVATGCWALEQVRRHTVSERRAVLRAERLRRIAGPDARDAALEAVHEASAAARQARRFVDAAWEQAVKYMPREVCERTLDAAI